MATFVQQASAPSYLSSKVTGGEPRKTQLKTSPLTRLNGNKKHQLSTKVRKSISSRASFGPGPISGGVLTPELKQSIDDFIAKHKVVLFMKGNKQFPQCGFSNTCVQILNIMQVPYETVNILEDEKIRQGMKEYSSWPTFPQLYIDGEFFGGCDITIEAYQNGELKEALEKAMLS